MFRIFRIIRRLVRSEGKETGIEGKRPNSTGPKSPTPISMQWSIYATKREKSRDWTCSICNDAWHDSDDMKRHLFKHHGIAPVQVGFSWMGWPNKLT